MSVIIHLAGTASAEAIPKLRSAVRLIQPMLEKDPGYERAELLVNHREHKVQVLLQWRSFDEAVAFLKNEPQLTLPFKGLMQQTAGPFFFAIENGT